MATKASRKTPTPAPTPRAPLTAGQIAERFTSEAARIQERLEKTKGQFLARISDSPTDAMEWLGVDIIEKETEAKEWGWVLNEITAEGVLFDRLTVISDRAREELSKILRCRSWEANSTSAVANVVRMYRTSGRVKALEDIGVYASLAMKDLSGLEKEQEATDTEITKP